MDLKTILFQQMKLKTNALKGRTALVTGGAKGIGKQTALGLGLLGVRVAIVDKDHKAAEQTINELKEFDIETLFIHTDISIKGKLIKAIDQVRESWQQIDILVNNAAQAFIGSYREESHEIWNKIFNTNLKYPAAAIKYLLPNMQKKNYGVIANVISLEGLAFSTAYSAAKVGMRSLTTSLSTEIGPDCGVSLFSFSPGIVDTPLVNDYFYPELANRFGLSMQNLIDGIGGNPGYKGLMPAEHCGAALVECIAHAETYRGQMTGPFLSLAKAGIINFNIEKTEQKLTEQTDNEGLETVKTSLKEYLRSVTDINRNLEHLVEVKTQELIKANKELKKALSEVKQLSGLLPICASCKNIRDDKGYWNKLEGYLHTHTEAVFSHSICPDCADKLYPNLDLSKLKKTTG